jgi:hypothetical protein
MKRSPYLPMISAHQATGARLSKRGLLWEYMLPTTIAQRQHTVTCHGTVSQYDRDISHQMSSTNVSISQRIVSVYESHQSAISQQ